ESQSQSRIGRAGAITVDIFNNQSVASIEGDAFINQDSQYQTDQQSVKVAAETYLDTIKEANSRETTEGNGIGVAVPINVALNTATAQIGSGATVHVGSAGSLNVTAVARNFILLVSLAGGKSASWGFNANVAFAFLHDDTRAQIAGGVTVLGGGSVAVDAND